MPNTGVACTSISAESLFPSVASQVPSKIWLGVLDLDPEDADAYEEALIQMNEVLFCGLSELCKEDRSKVVAHVMNRCPSESPPLQPHLQSPPALYSPLIALISNYGCPPTSAEVRLRR